MYHALSVITIEHERTDFQEINSRAKLIPNCIVFEVMLDLCNSHVVVVYHTFSKGDGQD